MARKSKRMALYEAIRQGQAKIAQGLESGQMRSDGTPPPQKSPERIPDRNALLNTLNQISGISALSKILAITVGVAVLVLVLFIIWLAIRPEPGNEPVITESQTQTADSPPTMTMQSTEVEQPQNQAPKQEESSGFFGFGGKKEPQQTTTSSKPVESSAAPGQNVIVIQQVHPDQQDKLQAVRKYYQDNGIGTEMLQRSGYILLVTRSGFDYNPNNEGTEANRLMQRIRRLGLAYPDATGDTKFGLRPFQDAYALKK